GAPRGRPLVILRKFDKSSLDRVLLDVTHMRFIIAVVANTMIAESALPHRKRHLPFFAHPVRRTAFDELHGPLQRQRLGWRNEHMKMLRHHHKCMQRVIAQIAILDQRFNEYPADLGIHEETPALPCSRCDEVRPRRVNVSSWRNHYLSG